MFKYFFNYLIIIHYLNNEVNANDDFKSSLQLLHIIFRHGDRTTDPLTLYPNDPHFNESYYPYGRGELTNEGKRRVYNLGKVLRQRYDKFLGVYTPDIVEAWSSNVNRTKTSLQLVLAGLFPPVGLQKWDDGLNWQPIPFNTLPISQDVLFFGSYCPTFNKLFSNLVKSTKYKQEFNQHRDFFKFVSENSGLNVTTYLELFRIYVCLTTEKEYGLELPQWTGNIYPKPLRDFAVKSYDLFTATSEMRRFSSGFLLNKIIEDTKMAKNEHFPYKNRKIFLYSAHEFNVAFMLQTLGIFEPHIPPYASYISFELHKINDDYGFKIYYQNYSSVEPKLMKLSACDVFCPFHQFVNLVEEYFPLEESCLEKLKT